MFVGKSVMLTRMKICKMKKIKNKTLIIILGISILDTIKYFILAYYFLTDINFYQLTYNQKDLVEINHKLYYMQIIPIIIYSLALLTFCFKYKLNFFTGILIYILTISINRFFELRDLLFFISNHRYKLYIANIISICSTAFIIQYFYRKSRNNITN